jgi:hypothetical protein
MKIVNETGYRTEDLRRFIVIAHEATATEMPEWKVVRVVWSKHNVHWGCAYYDNSGMTLTIPKGKLSMAELARVTEHELAHNRGIKHGDMDAELMHRRMADGSPFQWTLPGWAEGIELRLVGKRAAPTMQARIDERSAHAAKMAALWERKLAVAKKRVRKWTAKVRYYETRGPVAARPVVERPPKVVDPAEVTIVLRGEPAGEWSALIMDLASESSESDRIAMARWLNTASTRSGYRFRVMAETLPHVLTLESELTYWQHHNEVTGRSFPRILAKVIAARKAFQAKEPKSTPTEG